MKHLKRVHVTGLLAGFVVTGVLTVGTPSPASAEGDCSASESYGNTLELDNGNTQSSTGGGCTVEEPPAPKPQPPAPQPPAPEPPAPQPPAPQPPAPSPEPPSYTPETPSYTPEAPTYNPPAAPAPVVPTPADVRKPNLSANGWTVCHGRVEIKNTGDGAGVAFVNGKKYDVPAKGKRIVDIPADKAGVWKAIVKFDGKKVVESGQCGCPAPSTKKADKSDREAAVAPEADVAGMSEHEDNGVCLPLWALIAGAAAIAGGGIFAGSRVRGGQSENTESPALAEAGQ